MEKGDKRGGEREGEVGRAVKRKEGKEGNDGRGGRGVKEGRKLMVVETDKGGR